MQDVIQPTLHVQVLGHVVLDEPKRVIPEKMGDVVHAARDQIVNADHLVAFPDQSVTQMRSEKPGPARY